jgi:hypothetical protein
VAFLRRRKKRPEDDSGRALYVHLANDGAIFVIWGATGEQAWIAEAELHEELEKLRESGGRLIYSRDQAEGDPPEQVMETFERMVNHEVPIQLLEEPHPEALVPPDQRRTLRREAG